MRYNRGLKRRKAPFGTVEAATLAAATIQAATMIGTSTAEMKAAKENAKQAADIAISNTDKEVAALRKQNENANELQAKNQEFISAQNEENRDIQKTIQMNLQMMAAKQNEADRLATTRIQVRNGGSIRSKAMYGNLKQPLLQGDNTGALQVSVHDGVGGLLPIAPTENGNLYMVIGKDHDHENGDGKTGLGLEIKDSLGRKSMLEVEGNQTKGADGELLHITPFEVNALTKHTIPDPLHILPDSLRTNKKGFNPKDAVLYEGLNPNIAMPIQQFLKYVYGIPDDGKKAENGKSIEDKTLFHKQWLEGRTKQLEKAVKNYGRTNFVFHPLMAFHNNTQKTLAQNLKNNFINAITNVGEYYPNTINHAPNKVKTSIINDAYNRFIPDPDATLSDLYNTLGILSRASYYHDGKFIAYYNDTPDNTTKIHERTHVGDNATGQLLTEMIYNDNIDGDENYYGLKAGFTDHTPKNKFYDDKTKGNLYYDNAKEIHARLNEWRYKNNINPKKEWTIDEIKQLRKDGKLKLGQEEEKDLDRYNDEFLLHLFNDVAYNTNSSNKNRPKANSGYQVVNDLFTANDMIIPDMSQDTTGAIAGSAMRSKLKCGGRRKAKWGDPLTYDDPRLKINFQPKYRTLEYDPLRDIVGRPDISLSDPYARYTRYIGDNNLGLDNSFNPSGTPISLSPKAPVNDSGFRNPIAVTPDTDLIPDLGYNMITPDTDISPELAMVEPGGKTRTGLTNAQAQLLGATITGVGNAIGSVLTIAGNRASNRIRNAGINSATDLALAGYDQLHGIDYSSINRDTYKTAHEMPAIRLARYNIEPQLTGVSRSLERQRSAIANNTMSGAAAINRLNRAETNAYDMRSKLYGTKDNQEEAIKQKNIDIINKAIANNTTRDMQSNLYRTRDLLDLAKYNNNIDNTKIALKTKAKTDRTLSIANNNALTRQTNMGVAANAFSSTAQGYANTLGEIGKQRAELDYTLLGSDMKTTMDLLDKYANSSDPVKRRYALRMRKQIGFTNRT